MFIPFSAKCPIIPRNAQRIKKKANQLGSFRNYVDRNPLPLFSFREFTFSYFGPITSNNGGFWSSDQEFGLNRLINPGFGTTADKALGVGELFPALYRRFKVYSTRVTVTFYDPSEDGMAVCAYATNSSNPTYTLAGAVREDAAAAPYAVTRVISNTGEQRTTVGGRFSMNLLYNITADQFKNDIENTTGSWSGDPALSPRFKLCAASATGTTTATVRYKIVLSMWAMCYDRTNLVMT